MKVNFKGNEFVDYVVDEPAIFTFCKNETLDSGKIRISNVSEDNRLNLEPFDLVCITDDERIVGVDIYMLVDTVTETITCLNPKIYSYEIDLFSETKVLENIILPNKKITKIPGVTRSVYYYLNQYLNLYGEKIRVGNTTTYSWSLKYILSKAVQDKFDSIECPEMQWNQPTLREVLNDLMMVGDCIPVVKHTMIDSDNITKYKVIDYMYLPEKGKDISEDSHINYITSSKSSEDYVSDLYVDLKNVTNPESDEVFTYVVRNKYYPFTSDTSFVTTDNAILKTQYPIYKLRSLKAAIPYDVYIPGSDGNRHTVWLEFDLCNLRTDDGHTLNFVYEEQQWQLLKEKYDAAFNENFNDWPTYRPTTLYYTRNSDTIGGWSQLSKRWVITHSFWQEMAEKLFLNCKQKALIGTPLEGVSINNPSDRNYYMASFFTIEYETLQGSVFKAGKGENQTHRREIIDNQTNSYVDSYNAGFLEYQKANRLGNLQLQINARYSSSEEEYSLIKIGDYYEDNIVYQTQYQVFRNHIEVTALATKDYILRNYFTGVKSKIRSWVIASAGDALTRHDINKYYLEFSYDYHFENWINGVSTYHNVSSEYFLSPFLDNSEIKPLKAVSFYTNDNTARHPGQSEPYLYYAIDLISRMIGNSIVFTFGLKDNALVDKYVTNELTIDTYPGLTTDNYRYVDKNGEFNDIEYRFVHEINPVISLGTYPITINVWNKLRPRPGILDEDILDTVDYFSQPIYYLYKDSQEITYISTQFEFCSKTKDIQFSKNFIMREKCIRTNVDDWSDVFIFFPDEYYTNRNIEDITPNTIMNSYDDYLVNGGVCKYTYVPDNGLAIELHPTVQGILGGFSSQSECQSWINDVANMNCLISINLDADKVPAIVLSNIPSNNWSIVRNSSNKYWPVVTIYLNPLKDRNKDVYTSREDDLPSDEI